MVCCCAFGWNSQRNLLIYFQRRPASCRLARMAPKTMKVVYKPHLKIRLKQRKIPIDYPKRIIESPNQEYFDTFSRRNISVKKLYFEGRMRNILVAYDIIKRNIEIVTIHVISSKEISNKIRSGRWKEYEKN